MPIPNALLSQFRFHSDYHQPILPHHALASPLFRASNPLPESPVSLAHDDVVLHIVIQPSRLLGEFETDATKGLLQHGVIPGSSQTKARGINSPGTYEASLMWPCNGGERQWNAMSDWTRMQFARQCSQVHTDPLGRVRLAPSLRLPAPFNARVPPPACLRWSAPAVSPAAEALRTEGRAQSRNTSCKCCRRWPSG
jgi:hypothetical protein